MQSVLLRSTLPLVLAALMAPALSTYRPVGEEAVQPICLTVPFGAARSSTATASAGQTVVTAVTNGSVGDSTGTPQRWVPSSDFKAILGTITGWPTRMYDQ